ncbi:hypothetical protein ACFX15_041396 [Malus domestica]
MNAGVRGIEEAATIDIIALGYMAIGYWLCVKDGEPLLDSVLVHMGSMYSTLGKFEKSMSAYRRAVSNMENIYESSRDLVVPLFGLGNLEQVHPSFRDGPKA